MDKNISSFSYHDSLPKIVFVRFTKTVTLPASANFSITREDMGWFIPTGYRPLGLVEFQVPAAQAIVRGVHPCSDVAANTNIISIRNRSSSAYENIDVSITYAFIENVFPFAKDTDIMYYDRHRFDGQATFTWADWEQDLPANAGTLLTMANAGLPE